MVSGRPLDGFISILYSVNIFCAGLSASFDVLTTDVCSRIKLSMWPILSQELRSIVLNGQMEAKEDVTRHVRDVVGNITIVDSVTPEL